MLDYLFGAASFLPHGFCLLWRPDLVALHVISDVLIGLAYFSIPVAIMAYLRKRPDFEYRWVARLFAAFIIWCGTTHFMGAVMLWWPAYGLDGMIKAVTAAVSITTAVLLWPLLPKIVAIPSPRQLEEANRRLEGEIAERRAAEAALRQARDELERRVIKRTVELARSEERTRLAAEAGNIGLWDWDLTTDAVERSLQCKAILGSLDDPSVHAFFDRIHPGDRDKAEQELNNALDRGTLQTELRILGAEDDVRWLDIRGTVVTEVVDGEPKPTRFLGTLIDITERVHAAEALRASLAEKETLLREIHHRVKNNLQSLLALLQMEKRTLKAPNLAARLDAMRSRIEVMAGIHENLYSSATLSQVSMGPQIAKLCEGIREMSPSPEHIQIAVDADDLPCSIETAVPFGLMVNEIVSNAVKHAFPEGQQGYVRVSLHRRGDAVVLTVQDNGVGDPGHGGNGIGKMLIKALARQLGGDVETSTDAGTTVRVAVPAKAFLTDQETLPIAPAPSPSTAAPATA